MEPMAVETFHAFMDVEDWVMKMHGGEHFCDSELVFIMNAAGFGVAAFVATGVKRVLLGDSFLQIWCRSEYLD